jgi:S-methylmethionine-dependent homocysteine/selenocysteine methylase
MDAAIDALVAECLACFNSANPGGELARLLARLERSSEWSARDKQELREVIVRMHREFMLARGRIPDTVLVSAEQTRR